MPGFPADEAPRIPLGRSPLIAAAAITLALAACAGGADPDLDLAPLASAEQPLTCLMIENTGPNTYVEDAPIVTDPADPTKANTSFGLVTLMNTGFVGTDYRRVLIKFDLAGAGVPLGSTVSSATLTLRMAQSLGKNPVDVYTVTAPWSGSTVTWNQMAAAPNAGLGELLTTIPTLGVPNTSVLSIPLPASAAQAWVNPLTNTGLLLDHPAQGRTAFGASEAPPPSRPKLEVCYEPPSCTDGVQNQGEGGVDCDGPCASCAAGPSCAEVLATTPGAQSGIYLVDLDGPGPLSAFPEYCDMQTAGGGFTLVAVFSNKDATSWESAGAWSQAVPFGAHADIGQGDYKSPAFGRLAATDLLITQKPRDATNPLDGGAGYWRHTASAFAGTGNLMNLYNSLTWPLAVCLGGSWSCAAYRAPLTHAGPNGTIGAGDEWGFSMKTYDRDDGTGSVMSPYYYDDFMGARRVCNFGSGRQAGAPDVGESYGNVGGPFCVQASGATTQFLLWER